LARTGASSLPGMVAVALIALALGTVLVRAARRRLGQP
jgi:LPXTG-motif cell wall-anchored protein